MKSMLKAVMASTALVGAMFAGAAAVHVEGERFGTRLRRLLLGLEAACELRVAAEKLGACHDFLVARFDRLLDPRLRGGDVTGLHRLERLVVGVEPRRGTAARQQREN